jgi:glycosyltransferase involved in cell wall biosynthesis
VVATRVGSFPEYLQDGFQGRLCDSNSQSIARAIIEMLTDTNYIKIQKNIASSSFEHVVEHNAAIFREVYS